MNRLENSFTRERCYNTIGMRRRNYANTLLKGSLTYYPILRREGGFLATLRFFFYYSWSNYQRLLKLGEFWSNYVRHLLVKKEFSIVLLFSRGTPFVHECSANFKSLFCPFFMVSLLNYQKSQRFRSKL